MIHQSQARGGEIGARTFGLMLAPCEFWLIGRSVAFKNNRTSGIYQSAIHTLVSSTGSTMHAFSRRVGLLLLTPAALQVTKNSSSTRKIGVGGGLVTALVEAVLLSKLFLSRTFFFLFVFLRIFRTPLASSLARDFIDSWFQNTTHEGS